MVACIDHDVDNGNVALRIGDYDRAVKNFSMVLDEDPGHRDARYGLALAYYAIAEEREKMREPTIDLWKQVVREFEILSHIDDGGSFNGMFSNSLFYLAKATMENDEKAHVLPLLNKSILLDSLNFFSMNLKGVVLGRQGLKEEARNNFVYIVTREPKFASAYVNLGNLYWNDGDVESAWDIWSLGLKNLPESHTLRYWTEVAEDSLKSMVLSNRL